MRLRRRRVAADDDGDRARRGEMHAPRHRCLERGHPLRPASAARRSSSCRSFVLMSIQVAPSRSVVSIPSSPATTSATAAGDGRQVITTSASLAACGGRGGPGGARVDEPLRAAGRDRAPSASNPARRRLARKVRAERADADEPDPHGKPSGSFAGVRWSSSPV